MNEPEVPKKSWGCLQWGVVIVVGFLGAVLFFAPFQTTIPDLASQTSTSNNARQIIMAMKIYANDHNGVYPDSAHPEVVTANQVFRELFRDDIIQDERVFGAKATKFQPDGDIGIAPDFAKAVTAGENHWALVAGQDLKTPGHYPLVFENAVDPSWPPKWDPKLVKQLVRGRPWRGNKVIIGFNDNSVNIVILEKTGPYITLPKSILEPDGKSPLPPLKVLDIEEG